MTPAKFSESNIVNSLSLAMATQLLAAGYLVYWQYRDVVQTNAGWYPQWSVNRTAYLADVTFAAAVAGAQGLMTVVTEIPAAPRFVVRLISDTSVGATGEISVPTCSVEVGSAIPTANYELGTPKKFRSRHLICDAYVRTVEEQRKLADLLAIWFDNDLTIDIVDHDAGTLAPVGYVTVASSTVRTDTLTQGLEVTTYQAMLNARLVYVA